MSSTKKRLRQAAKLTASMAALLGMEMSVFEQFALAASFDQASWDSFVSDLKAQQQNSPQTLLQHRHNNYSDYSQYSQLDTDHSNDWRHYNASGDSHSNVFGHSNGTYSQGHWNEHNNNTHNNYPDSHNDKYSQSTVHTNHTQHSNAGYTHDNYVPSVPVFYQLAADAQLSGVAKIGVYSYDKNSDGFGSQDSYSKLVKYDLTIQKVKNLNGTSSVSTVRTLVANASELPTGGLLYDLNTIDPLGTGNTNPATTEGYYKIQAIAKNVLSNGVVQSSVAQVVEVMIKQNQAPTLAVTNSGEFLRFTFGFDGALSPGGVYKKYSDGLYSGAAPSQSDGILVRVTMKDPDSATTTQQQWQKGTVTLRSASGAAIATTDLIWTSTGNNIASSENTDQSGVAFIPKGAYLGPMDYANAYLEIRLSDYLDAACIKPTGTTVTQKTISATNLTQLTVSVDVTKPIVTASNTNYTWQKTNQALGLTFQDVLSGILMQEYQVTPSTTQPTSGWLPYTTAPTLSQDGQWYLWYHSKDKVENEIFGYFGPYQLDKTPPTATHTLTDLAANQIRIDLTGQDATSGVKRIKLPSGTWVAGAVVSYTVPAVDGTYNFVVEDNAGNQTVVPVVVNVTPFLKGLVMTNIVNPPLGTTAPITYPVATPTRIKAGYQMDFKLETLYTNRFEIRLYDHATGAPLPFYTPSSPTAPVTATVVAVSSTADVFTNFSLWLDQNLPLGTQVDMKITAYRDLAGGTTKTTVDTTYGADFEEVVGSSLQDATINQTH